MCFDTVVKFLLNNNPLLNDKVDRELRAFRSVCHYGQYSFIWFILLVCPPTHVRIRSYFVYDPCSCSRTGI